MAAARASARDRLIFEALPLIDKPFEQEYTEATQEWAPARALQWRCLCGRT
jgi:hypothetical protein